MRKLNNIRRKSKRRKIRKNKKTGFGAGNSKSKPFDSRELRIASERSRLYFQEKSNRRFNTSENHNHPIRHRRTKERSRRLNSKIR